METKPTEMTYAAELKSIIDSFNQGFHAEVEKKIEGENLRIDLLVYHKDNLQLIVEIKRPEKCPSINDSRVTAQAKEYAQHLEKHHSSLRYFGTHNLKHLLLYQKRKSEKKRLHDFEKPTYTWQLVRPYPWSILPSASKITDFQGRRDEIFGCVKEFLLDFKTMLEGKTQPMGPQIVQTIASQLEEIANFGGFWFFEKYKNEKGFQTIFERWLKEHGIRRPENDEKAKTFLRQLAMEQAYTITLKLMFYHVLRLKYERLSTKLSDISIAGEITPEVLKSILNSLFKQAVIESSDFQVVFETDLVDSLSLPKYSIHKFMKLFNFLREVDWRSLDYDIIGTIFEEMIYEQRRHLLGQYFTRPEVVDLILSFSLRGVGHLLDPCVGSGTFLVRAYQRLRYLNPSLPHSDLASFLAGMDIDKNVAMLAAINIYIRDPLTAAVAKPRISRMDFFSEKAKPLEKIPSLSPQDELTPKEALFEFELPQFDTVVANPPYTRQEEMESAFYSAEYKSKIVANAIKPVILPDGRSLRKSWSMKASIYSYFLVKSASQFLKENGRLGFITSNSWLDSSFGSAIKEYFLTQFKIVAIIESSIERWFEDADINTSILIVEKMPANRINRLKTHKVKFVSLKIPLASLIGRSPSGFDITEMRNYWSDLDRLTLEIENAENDDIAYQYGGKNLSIAVDDDKMRVITVPQGQLKAKEKWSIFLRAPRIWFEILSSKDEWFTGLEESGLYDVRRGFTTNANELYYLPSKQWKIISEKENAYHILQGPKELALPKSIVKPVVKSSTALKKYYVERKNLKRLLVYLNEKRGDIKNKAVLEYICWMENYMISEFFANGRFPTLVKKLLNPEVDNRIGHLPKSERAQKEGQELKAIAKDFLDGKLVQTFPDWFMLPKREAAQFLCVPGINQRFAFYLNSVGALEDKRLYAIYVNIDDVPIEVFFAVLNCSITYLAIELWGRTQLGLGVLDLAVEDYEAVPVLDAVKIWRSIQINEALKNQLLELVTRITKEDIFPIKKEVKKENRQKLDSLLMSDILGLSHEQVQAVESELVKLVARRIARARTIELSRRGKDKKN